MRDWLTLTPAAARRFRTVALLTFPKKENDELDSPGSAGGYEEIRSSRDPRDHAEDAASATALVPHREDDPG